MASYHNDHGCLPGYIVNRYTPFARCLPYIDQQVLFDALNFSIEPGSPENSTAASRRIEQFLCPDRASPDATDGPRPKPVGRPDVETAGCSYAVNIGSGDWDKHEDGPFRVGVACRWADIVDGLAATGLASEIVAGGEARGRFRGYLVETKNVGSEAAFLQDCLAADPASRPRSALGTSWISDGIFSTPYNHSLTPNQRGCEATNSPLYRCAFTASSLHEPTVNLLMADGSVRPVDESIAGTLWRSIGSRNGGEVQ